TGDDRQEVFVSHAWMRLFGIRAPLVHEFILEFFSTFRIKDEMGLDVAGSLCFQLGGARGRSERLIPDKGDLSDYWVEISSGRDFLRGAPSYTYIRDLIRRLFHRLISYNIFRRGHAPEKVTATDLFYLRSISPGATNVSYLLAQYLFRHAEGRKSGARQPIAAAGAPEAAEDAPRVNEGVQADLAPIQAPQPPTPPPATGRTMP
ncbi:hypothetical protein Tco_1159884, partial [Tanacetum coccineum]